MPCSDDSLDCAACGCHPSDTDLGLRCATFRMATPVEESLACSLRLLTPYNHNLKPSRSSGILLQTGNSIGASVGAATESSSEELMAGPPPPQHQQHQFIVSRKRIRTKFTADKREGMLAFAEQDGAAVEQFCCEVGVRRKVLKRRRWSSSCTMKDRTIEGV
ncbi:unnamed protein product [Musa acuminata subsp. malaccensis]|uniref:(wild Malaysian banana) hypothetical protein n=1 Tax=Musa acuminata subsp. malaccensis TaxID=214687 RepID=A0A804JEV3_MUSAM|nr:PREDICTED: zinc-finger homeodomain protein 6-like [Musa acuminata subsp. malaccensis]CAG1845874.1 unnamed protein product [Musa acuminata subsp. malaccensis]